MWQTQFPVPVRVFGSEVRIEYFSIFIILMPPRHLSPYVTTPQPIASVNSISIVPCRHFPFHQRVFCIGIKLRITWENRLDFPALPTLVSKSTEGNSIIFQASHPATAWSVNGLYNEKHSLKPDPGLKKNREIVYRAGHALNSAWLAVSTYSLPAHFHSAPRPDNPKGISVHQPQRTQGLTPLMGDVSNHFTHRRIASLRISKRSFSSVFCVSSVTRCAQRFNSKLQAIFRSSSTINVQP